MEFERKLLNAGYLRYVAHLGEDSTPLEAARMSTGRPTGVDLEHDDRTRDYLWRHAHATPFEMAVLQVEVQCPIFVAREWMRHRTFSYNEFSGRYAEMPAVTYLPSEERLLEGAQSKTNKQGSGERLEEMLVREAQSVMRDEQDFAHDNYAGYLDRGIARELARINLPLSQYTRFRAQANLRNWLHFLNLRMAPNAQYEIRVYAQAVAELIKQIWPKTWETFEEHTLGAVTFSRTEMELLRMYLWDLSVLLNCEPEEMFKEPAPVVLEKLGKSRAREFLEKLGV